MSSAPSPDAVRLIEAAAELGPTINGLRDEIERERRLPRGLVETLRKLGFFSLWLARDFGGMELSLADFVRVMSVQRITREGLARLAPTILPLARAEGLEAHAESIEVRLGGKTSTIRH